MPRPWPSSIVHKMFGERRCGPRNVAYGVGGAVFRCLNGRGGDSCDVSIQDHGELLGGNRLARDEML